MQNPTSPAPIVRESIRVRGAREHNLRGIDVDIPKHALTVFTGVSGSGKSSLVFGTIAAESQRLLNESYSAFLQSFMPRISPPHVDELQGLSAAIVVGQERMGANSRSTVGTATEANTMLRILFSEVAAPAIGSPSAFSFNGPEGMCPTCEGRGEISAVDVDVLVDRGKSLDDGAITVPNFGVGTWHWRGFVESGLYPTDIPIGEFTTTQLDDLLHKEPTKLPIAGMNMTYEGLVVKVTRLFLSKEREALQPHIRAFVDRAVAFQTCPDCQGARLNTAALSARIAGKNIAECSSMQISELAEIIRDVEDPSVAPLVATLSGLLDSLIEIGLGYLSLDRSSTTLSGGEAQRVKMVRHLGSSLTDITYVFDEPTVGLHPHDVSKMNDLLLRLRDKGNTVLVVEHKPETIAIADHIVDLGPGAGTHGGRLCFEGSVDELRASGSLTGRHLDHRAALRERPRPATGHLPIRGATQHNLRSVDVDVPLGALTVVTGVAGSGKSSLIHGYLPDLANVIVADQAPIRGSRRSNPATYTGLLDAIRSAFAKANDVKPSLFSANSEGACRACSGAGMTYSDLVMMAGVPTVCEECGGDRYKSEVLAYTLHGKNIAEVLALTVADAHEFFTGGKTRAILSRLHDVGLEYLTLGQPLNTLSGGERQRLKLATSMTGTASVYILDEPTTGLHLADIDRLLALLDRLVDAGNSVIVIEHHQAVMAYADWIIDLGPGAGYDGGTVVFEGTPLDLCTTSDTLTAQHLRDYLGLAHEQQA